MFKRAETIVEVVSEMDKIITYCINKKSKLGFFAVLYRDVTIQVQEKLKIQFFENNERMERLDVIFANRYLEAFYCYQNGLEVCASWQVAFNCSSIGKTLILQDLLLGMNAHINFDLAIASDETVNGKDLQSLKNDFNKIMDILSSMIETVQERIDIVSPAFKLLDWFGGKTDEKIAGFVINKARDNAWSTAEKLVSQNLDQKRDTINKLDQSTYKLGKSIARPNWFLAICFFFIRRRESRDVSLVIATLNGK